MEAIFPITALSKQQQEVKDAAREDVVRITEHGAAAWVFASEEAFERRVQRAVDDALYEAQLEATVARGMKDAEQGRIVVGTEAAKAWLERSRRAQ